MSYGRFRTDNTEGYTQEQLAELNRRYTERVNAGPATAYAGPKGDDPAWLDWRKAELDYIAERVQAEFDTELSSPSRGAAKPLALALLALLLAFPALAAPAHRIKPLETVTVKTMPAGSLKPGEGLRVTALDADSCTVWIKEPVNGETAFRACRSAILRCQGGDCRKGGAK